MGPLAFHTSYNRKKKNNNNSGTPFATWLVVAAK
jgi:hypothetical protein